MKTQVAIIGGGPAGSLLSLLLQQRGISSVVLERGSKDLVLSRVRAGVLEYGSAEVLRALGVGDRMEREGSVQYGVNLAFQGRRLRIDFTETSGRPVTVYGQSDVQRDLYEAMEQRDIMMVEETGDVELHDADSESPSVTFTKDGTRERLDCDWIAGCDGYRGVSRTAFPSDMLRTFQRDYPFGWLGVLSETPPVSNELLYINHERGFALCSMRNEMLSRYYIQCPTDTDPGAWTDDHFWDELTRRLPKDVASAMVTGPSIEKSVTPLRSFVAEPMRHGRVLLAGDAAHIIPPTAAKGLNHSVTDVVYLWNALTDYYNSGSTTGVDNYSEQTLLRVWRTSRFSWWMTTMLHRFDDADDFDRRLQLAEFSYLESSSAARASFAENYTGLRFNLPA